MPSTANKIYTVRDLKIENSKNGVAGRKHFDGLINIKSKSAEEVKAASNLAAKLGAMKSPDISSVTGTNAPASGLFNDITNAEAANANAKALATAARAAVNAATKNASGAPTSNAAKEVKRVLEELQALEVLTPTDTRIPTLRQSLREKLAALTSDNNNGNSSLSGISNAVSRSEAAAAAEAAAEAEALAASSTATKNGKNANNNGNNTLGGISNALNRSEAAAAAEAAAEAEALAASSTAKKNNPAAAATPASPRAYTIDPMDGGRRSTRRSHRRSTRRSNRRANRSSTRRSHRRSTRRH